MDRVFFLILLSVFALTSISTQAETAKTDYRLDNEFFRRGLIDRGFDEWLKVYDKQHPPASDLDLLAQQIGQCWLEYRRETNLERRRDALAKLLTLELDRVDSYPDHPLSANWRVRYASDLLNEQLGGQTFIHLVGLDLPEESRKPFQSTLDQVEVQLDKAKQFLGEALAKFEHLDNDKLAQINRQGLPELYRSAMLQSDYLRAWCWYHRARFESPGSPAQVKILYRLSDLLGKMAPENVETAAGSTQLIGASVARMLGKFSQGQAIMKQARKSLPTSYLLFADIEQASIALAENQPDAVLKIIATARKAGAYKQEAQRQDLVDIELLLLEGQARLKMLSRSQQAEAEKRNEVWKNLTARLIAQPGLRIFAFPRILDISESCPQDTLADIELYAHAERAIQLKKTPLVQAELQDLLSRKEVPMDLKISAAALLSRTYEQQGRFTDAFRTLQGISEVGKTPQAGAMASESARLAWMAYRATPNDKLRATFIEAANRLLTQFPQHESADQFKLLMAEDFSQAGEFNQAIQ
jgi:hypothetical protein